jgi:hypothetical protein
MCTKNLEYLVQRPHWLKGCVVELDLKARILPQDLCQPEDVDLRWLYSAAFENDPTRLGFRKDGIQDGELVDFGAEECPDEEVKHVEADDDRLLLEDWNEVLEAQLATGVK